MQARGSRGRSAQIGLTPQATETVRLGTGVRSAARTAPLWACATALALGALALAALALGASLSLAALAPVAAFADEPSGTSQATLTGATPAGAATPALTDEQKLANANVKVRAKVQDLGWQKTVKSGKTAGTSKKKGLRGLRMKLTGLGGVKGSIRYKVYVPGSGWKSAKDWKALKTKKDITAVRVWLAGKVKNYYNVYYRVRTGDFKWLGWAKNKQVAGATKSFTYANAVQVKLVKKTKKFKGSTKYHQLKTRWAGLEYKYSKDANVDQILEVKYKGGSRATVVLRQKNGTKWTTAVTANGYVGRNGMGRTREGMQRTPQGDYEITSAFGIKSDPGAQMEYVKVTNAMYWCGDRSYYNQLIDINEHPHDCAGEHLIDYSPHYDYGLFFDYNQNPIRYGAGSAFFVHCTGGTPYTAGCIAVSKSKMIQIIQGVSQGARICIYWQ